MTTHPGYFTQLRKTTHCKRSIWNVCVQAIPLLLYLASSTFDSFSQCANKTNIYQFTYGGKNYEIVKELKNWAAAAACAVERGGYLVHIDSASEQSAVYKAISDAGVSSNYISVTDGGGIAYVWIGATDKKNEGAWLWDGNGDDTGINFWNGQGSAGSNNGSTSGSSYVNWGGSPSYQEPDNFFYISDQDAAAIALKSWPYGSAGEWNDISTNNSLYYIIESSNSPTSVSDTKISELNMKLYPNPAKDDFQLQLTASKPMDKDYIWKLKNIYGQQINSGSINPHSNINFTYSINTSGIAPGTYFISLESEDICLITKLIIVE